MGLGLPLTEATQQRNLVCALTTGNKTDSCKTSWSAEGGEQNIFIVVETYYEMTSIEYKLSVENIFCRELVVGKKLISKKGYTYFIYIYIYTYIGNIGKYTRACAHIYIYIGKIHTHTHTHIYIYIYLYICAKCDQKCPDRII